MKTIEEKAKAYDEALAKAKMYRDNAKAVEDYAAVARYENVFPELAESEDEMIRKKLIGIFTNQSLCDVYNLKSEDVLAYLEKQKEQKPIEFKNDELVEIIKGEFEGFRNLLKKKGIDYEPQRGYWEGFARLFDSSAREYVKEQKEQIPERINVTEMVAKYRVADEYIEGEYKGKPVNCMIRAYEQGIRDTLSKLKEQKPTDDKAFEEWLDNWYQNFRLKSLRPQPKQEWSEEDKNIFNLALDLIKHSDDCDGVLDKELAVKWFAELPSRFIPQPKQEWNEEDVDAFVKSYSDSLPMCGEFQSYHEALVHAYRQGVVNTLKSFRPSWKPSRAQMSMLFAVINEPNNASSQSCHLALVELYQELQKL